MLYWLIVSIVIFKYHYALKFGILATDTLPVVQSNVSTLRYRFFPNGASNMFIVVYINSLLHQIMDIVIYEHTAWDPATILIW